MLQKHYQNLHTIYKGNKESRDIGGIGILGILFFYVFFYYYLSQFFPGP